jgi:LCP family protein required for cell wall assembly
LPEKYSDIDSDYSEDSYKGDGYKRSGTTAKIASAILLIIVLIVNFASTYVFGKLGMIIDTNDPDIIIPTELSSSDEYVSATEVSVSDLEVVETVLKKPDYISNILVVGTDSNNADTIMVVSLNSNDGTFRIISFMRDCYVKIPDHKGKHYGDQKINHAYAYGGGALLKKTLLENFGLEIDYYATVTYNVLPAIIDTLGGIPMELSYSEAKYMNMYYYNYNYEPNLKKGSNWLKGAQVLSYARCRFDSDYFRTKRQQKVILACANALKKASATRFNRVVNIACTRVKTDMSKDVILSYAASAPTYLKNLTEINQMTVPNKNDIKSGKVKGTYVVLVDREKYTDMILNYLYNGLTIESESTYTGGSFAIPWYWTPPSTESSSSDTSDTSTSDTANSSSSSKTSSTSSTSSASNTSNTSKPLDSSSSSETEATDSKTAAKDPVASKSEMSSQQ